MYMMLLSLVTSVFIFRSQKSRQSTHAQYALDRLNMHSLIAIKLHEYATLPLSSTVDQFFVVFITIKHYQAT